MKVLGVKRRDNWGGGVIDCILFQRRRDLYYMIVPFYAQIYVHRWSRVRQESNGRFVPEGSYRGGFANKSYDSPEAIQCDLEKWAVDPRAFFRDHPQFRKSEYLHPKKLRL